jgi:chaperone modulatory protein CbpM
MADITILYLSLSDLCHATELPSETLIEITEEGIIEPIGSSPENWQFSVQNVAIAQKATRLHKDLQIDWPGIALAISLLGELEQLRSENQQLKQRLQRFSPNKEY